MKAENRGALFGMQGTVSSLAWFCSPVMGGALSLNYGVNYVTIVIPIGLIVMLLAVKRLKF